MDRKGKAYNGVVKGSLTPQPHLHSHLRPAISVIFENRRVQHCPLMLSPQSFLSAAAFLCAPAKTPSAGSKTVAPSDDAPRLRYNSVASKWVY